MFVGEEIDNSNNSERQNAWQKMASKMPNFLKHIRNMRGINSEVMEHRATKQNREFQAIYDLAVAGQEDWEISQKTEELNCALESPFLASGQSGYFSEQIDKHGMSSLKLHEKDIEDAKYIAECFGKEISLSDDALDILYTTLPGTTEMNYAVQTFPAIIFEDVFQCSATHELPFPPKVGEKEEEYWSRVLSQKISETEDFPVDKVLETKMRGARLARNFCKGKNRIYLIPIKDIQDNKASFGDIAGLRGGTPVEGGHDKILQDVPSFQQLATSYYCPDIRSMYQNPNFTSEYGIAIYGEIQSDDLEYVEIERGYDTMQRKAIQVGMKTGDDIVLP